MMHARAGSPSNRIVLAPDVRAGQAEILTEEVAEEEARLHLAAMPRAVHGDVESDVSAHEARSVAAGHGFAI
jgi:hypothetical protein